MRRRAIALVRVSSAAQAGPDRQGLPAQRREIERLAQANDLEIVDTIELEGVSGSAVMQDPRFSSLLARLRDPGIDGVVVAAFDRLMRPASLADYAILEAFREAGAMLYTPEGPRDLREFQHRLLSVFQGEMAADERQRIRDRTKRGRDMKRRQGKRAEGLVGMPRGVTFDHATGQWSYAWPEAERIRLVFELFLSGETNLRAIHRQTGVGAPSEPSTAIARVLRQTLYRGAYRVDAEWVNGKRIPLPEDQVQEYQVLDPPLVSPEDWARAQVLLDRLRRSRAPRRDPETIPATYKGFMRCGLCNGSMLYQPDSRGYAGYYCGRSRRHGCTMGQVSVKLADPQLDAQVERMLGSEATLMALVARAAEDAARHAECPPAELQRRITQLENQRTRAKDAYMDGAFELPELQKRLAGLDGELAALRDLMDTPGAETLEVDAEAVRAVADVFCCWRDLPRAEKRELMRAFQVQLIVEKPSRGQFRVVRAEVGSLGNVGLYKKMKRLGIE